MTSFSQLIIRVCKTYVALALIINCQKWRVLSWKEVNVDCKSPECRRLGELYIRGINARGNPCHDFYDYVCRGWKDQHKKPDLEDVWSIDSVMGFKTMEDVRKLVENGTDDGIEEVKQVKRVYKACMNIPFLPISNPKDLKTIMTRSGSWPMFTPNYETKRHSTWWMVNMFYIKRTGKSALFDVIVKGDEAPKNQIMFQIEELESPYPFVEHSMSWSKKEKNAYVTYLYEVIKKVAPIGPGPTRNSLERELKEVLNFRMEIAKIREVPGFRRYTQLRIKDLNLWYNTAISFHAQCRVNWSELFRAFEGSRQNTKFSEEDIISIQQKYVLELCAVLKKTPHRVIVNHIHIYFVETHLPLGDKEKELLKRVISDSTQPSGKLIYNFERWMKCLLDSNMQETLSRMYVKAYFSKGKKYAVKQLITSAKSLLELHIANSSWLDPETKSKSITKVQRVNAVIGYPDWYDAPTIRNVQQYVYPIIPAAHLISKKTLSLTAAYLQSPIFMENMPYVIDYASLVATIGHELYHLFDESGIIKRDSACGHRGWWPRTMCNEYSKRTKCFTEHYTKHRNEALVKHGVHKFPRLMTLPEDLSDAMGLKLAYSGFVRKFNILRGACPVLPPFKTYGCRKLFFISFANVFCSNFENKAELRALLNSDHSIPSVRVNAAVSNMKEFTETFHCKPTDRLAVKKECDLWQ